jgi:HJR/Mrr/RecB family endonuclease
LERADFACVVTNNTYSKSAQALARVNGVYRCTQVTLKPDCMAIMAVSLLA